MSVLVLSEKPCRILCDAAGQNYQTYFCSSGDLKQFLFEIVMNIQEAKTISVALSKYLGKALGIAYSVGKSGFAKDVAGIYHAHDAMFQPVAEGIAQLIVASTRACSENSR